ESADALVTTMGESAPPWVAAKRNLPPERYDQLASEARELARRWLDALSDAQRNEVEIFACGPHPMLKASAQLARDYNLPCQVSLEEYMACAVGGCAGCVVEISTAQGPAMKRVCVDGPVFDASQVASFR
ncbi:MAG: dihydroorotate dehydrogenase electron transfer subunit, partial [Gammaproteobacteria bacterium]